MVEFICKQCGEIIDGDIAVAKCDYEYGGYLFKYYFHVYQSDDNCLLEYLSENPGKEYSVTYYRSVEKYKSENK